jgi:hypothetical protein
VYTGSEPDEGGLVTSLGRPEANVTGIALSINPQTVMAITVAAPHTRILQRAIRLADEAGILDFVITITANEGCWNYWCIA